MQVFPLGRILADLTDKDILRVNSMTQGCNHLVVVIGKFYLNHRLALRHGQQVNVLKTAVHLCGLLGILPLLEQSGKGVAVKCIASGLIGHGYLTVTLQIKVLHVDTAAGPTINHVQVIQINPGLLAVT